MSKYKMSKQAISVPGQAILIVHDENSSRMMPAASVQLREDIVDRIVAANEFYLENKEDAPEMDFTD